MTNCGRLSAVLVLQIHHGFSVALNPMAANGLFTGHSRIGDVAEFLTLHGVGDMHFHRRNAHGLQRIQNGNGSMGICRRIDDNAVEAVRFSIPDTVNDIAFVVALEKIDFSVFFVGITAVYGAFFTARPLYSVTPVL